MPRKGDFIIDLLKNKKLSLEDKNKIISLTAKEYEKNHLEIDNVTQLLQQLDDKTNKENSFLKKEHEGLMTKLKMELDKNNQKIDVIDYKISELTKKIKTEAKSRQETVVEPEEDPTQVIMDKFAEVIELIESEDVNKVFEGYNLIWKNALINIEPFNGDVKKFESFFVKRLQDIYKDKKRVEEEIMPLANSYDWSNEKDRVNAALYNAAIMDIINEEIAKAKKETIKTVKVEPIELVENSEELMNLKVQINEINSAKIVNSKTEVVKQNDLNKNRTLYDYIKPSLLREFLIAYNQNPILKTTCHKIDESELERLKEILEIEEYDFNKHLSKINEEYKKLTNNYKNVNINIRELIRVYLTGEGQGHWTTDKIKITWGSKQLKDWAKKYQGVPANPDDDVISNLENIGFEFDSISVNSGAKKIQTFSDLVIHFKHMFHLRSDNLLKDLILKKNIQKGWNNSILFEINHSDFWSNIELFCDVDKLIQSYVKIIDMILEVTKKNKLSKPKVKLKFKEEGDSIIFTIHHQNSKFKRTIQNIKEGRFGTKLTDLIQNQINGLCDFYIQADFDNNQFAQINLWNGEAIEPKPLKSYVGVEFILKFKG